jgi:aspartate aminotransferase-like enzyme
VKERAMLTRRHLPGMGLEFADYGPANSIVITCVVLPDLLTFSQLADGLKQKGIVIYNGKGPLKDKIFQIGHIGALRKGDTRFALGQIEKILINTKKHHPQASYEPIQNKEPIHVAP